MKGSSHFVPQPAPPHTLLGFLWLSGVPVGSGHSKAQLLEFGPECLEVGNRPEVLNKQSSVGLVGQRVIPFPWGSD